MFKPFKPGDLVRLVARSGVDAALEGIVGVVLIDPPISCARVGTTAYRVFWLSKPVPTFDECAAGRGFFHIEALEPFDWQKEGQCETTSSTPASTG